MIGSSRILYVVLFALFFCVSFYALGCIDFSRFTRRGSIQKIYLLLFVLSLALAWMSTEAIFALMYGPLF